MSPETASFQSRFHRRWKHLDNPHVRSLAWLLDAPDLLDPDAPQWRGKIATLGPVDVQTEAWLSALDKSPSMLHAYLPDQPYTRLGRYAEKLLAFYFEHRQMLVAHGLQVRDISGTIGEFDFLLRRGDQLLHWEFASKFYLLETEEDGQSADRFVGPNLADTLGAKVRKIMERQLNLSQHPAAQKLLPQPIAQAQALVKGWLFYRGYRANVAQPAATQGVSAPHCRGFWCPLGGLDAIPGEHFLVLPRLEWLAPAKESGDRCLDRHQLSEFLRAHFAVDAMPVLLAILERDGESYLETNRGFIVPDDWSTRAEERTRRMMMAP
jgi:hypothetical protein